VKWASQAPEFDLGFSQKEDHREMDVMVFVARTLSILEHYGKHASAANCTF
jgi:hypothetical protein